MKNLQEKVGIVIAFIGAIVICICCGIFFASPEVPPLGVALYMIVGSVVMGIGGTIIYRAPVNL